MLCTEYSKCFSHKLISPLAPNPSKHICICLIIFMWINTLYYVLQLELSMFYNLRAMMAVTDEQTDTGVILMVPFSLLKCEIVKMKNKFIKLRYED